MRKLVTLDVGGDSNRSYIILNQRENTAWCVDPSYGAEEVLETCGRAGASLTEIFLTHTHGDHIASLDELFPRKGVRVWVHSAEASRIPSSTPLPSEGALAAVPGVSFLHTPGHTPGGVCYRIDDDLFTGDVLFVDWVGRCDLPGGDARTLFHSLARLRALPGHLVIRPGHHYGCQESRSLEEETRLNPFLACTDFERFLGILPRLAE
jgi:hydroxyacylglutathione hydrolase